MGEKRYLQSTKKILYALPLKHREVIVKTADYLGADLNKVFGKSRKAPIVFNRHFIMYILRLKGVSTVKISGFFNRHYSTVVIVTNRFRDKYATIFEKQIEEILKCLKDADT